MIPSTTTSSRPGDRLARVVTEASSPAVLALVLLLVVSLRTSTSLSAGLVAGGLAVLFGSVIPMVFLVRGVRAGRWTDHHVRQREQRRVPLLFALGSVCVGLVVLALLDVPRDLLALVGAMVAGLVVALAVSQVWKISIHAAVAAGSAVILSIVVAVPLLVLVPVVALIAWSRVRLEDHDVAQVVGGALVGAAVAYVVFTALR